MTELEKALSGEQFDRRDKEIYLFQSKVKDMLYEFHHLKPTDPIKEQKLSKNL